MKTLIATTAAALALGFCAPAAALDLSDRNDGLTKRVMCTNVPASSGSVAGFFVPTIGYFVAEASADYASVDATVVPASVDVKDGEEVAAYLMALGLTNFALEIKTSERETELVEVSSGVFEEQTVSVNIPVYRRGFCRN